MAQRANSEGRLWPRIVMASVAIVGLLVAAAGLTISQNECEAACGTASDETFRDAMGYAAMVLGGLSIVLALRSRAALALIVAALGGFAVVAAFVEGMSHLS